MQTSNNKRRNQILNVSSGKNQKPVTKSQVRDMIRSLAATREEKWSAFSAVPAAVDYNGIVVSLADIDQGVTDSTRIGDSVYLKDFTINLWAIASAINAWMRIIIFQWLDLSVPTVGDLLLSSGGSSASFLSNYNADESLSRRIMFDNLFALYPGDGTNKVLSYSGKVPVKDLQFEGGTTDGRGKIYLLAISSAVSSPPTLGYGSKLTFYDA